MIPASSNRVAAQVATDLAFVIALAMVLRGGTIAPVLALAAAALAGYVAGRIGGRP